VIVEDSFGVVGRNVRVCWGLVDGECKYVLHRY
jgi:hypothetical protein